MLDAGFSGNLVTAAQLEKIRLLLSACQDGTGQLARAAGGTLPGWRDFERATALAFNGMTQESKAIFDVLVPMSSDPELYCGISCKMRKLLKTVERTGRVTIEVSNSSGKFWEAIKACGLEDYAAAPQKAGAALIEAVESWHHAVGIASGGKIALQESFYLVLQWDEKTETYRLFQYPLTLPDPEALIWSAPGKRLVGADRKGTLVEWYAHAGGQLKYYPSVAQALWSSEIFCLEPLPDNEAGYGLLRRVKEYYPALWAKVA